MKSTNTKIKNSLDRLNNIFKSIEEKVSEYKDRSREIQSEKTEQKNEQGFIDL